MSDQFIKVGKIVNTFGIKGFLKVYLHTDFPKDRFIKGNNLYIGDTENPDQIKAAVDEAKPYKNLYLVKLKGFDDINDVEKYKEKYLWITKDQQNNELQEGEFYYHQIIGCSVITTDGKEVGKIKEILSPGANDVWVVKAMNSKKEILIPYVEPIVKEINIDDKLIIIEEIEGLLS